jgi:Protein of unknown function (DUF3455)
MNHRTLIGLAAAALSCSAAAADALAPPAGERHAFTLTARGVQIYECRPADGDVAGAPSWVFVAPQAELFDASGRSVGTHGAGPHWQANDGSRIVGAIPWLLLVAHGRSGHGLFADVHSIQRVDTRGGSAPAGPCTASQLLRVPYSAAYHFFRTVDSDPGSAP